jgi:hypothetical protein
LNLRLGLRQLITDQRLFKNFGRIKVDFLSQQVETQGTCLLKQKLPVDRGGRDGAKQQNTVDRVGFQVAIEREISKKLKRGREGGKGGG